MKTRLTNRAITIGRLLARREIFDPNLIRQFDSLTAVSLREKVIQVYDSNEHEIYRYSDVAGDRIEVDKDELDHLRGKSDEIYFTSGNKEAIGYKYDYNNIKVFIDGDNGISIEKCVQFNRQLYKIIESNNFFPPGAFSLEVSSPGIDKPLKMKRQYLKNTGRNIEILFTDDSVKTGRLLQVSNDDIIIEETTGKGKKAETKQLVIPF